MLYRIFIAVNLPEEIKKELLAYHEKWPELPCRWTAPENLHLTLVFLGNRSEKELQNLMVLAKGVGERHQAFTLQIVKIVYGPSPRQPRMIWTMFEKSEALLQLQKDLEKSLAESQTMSYILEKRGYAPHLTLGRLNQWQLHQMGPEELPQIDEQISLSFRVNSFEIMESKLKRTGAQYVVLHSFPLR